MQAFELSGSCLWKRERDHFEVAVADEQASLIKALEKGKRSLVKYDSLIGDHYVQLKLDRFDRHPSREWLDDVRPIYMQCTLLFDGKDNEYHCKGLRKLRRPPPIPAGNCPYCVHGVGEVSGCTCGDGEFDES